MSITHCLSVCVLVSLYPSIFTCPTSSIHCRPTSMWMKCHWTEREVIGGMWPCNLLHHRWNQSHQSETDHLFMPTYYGAFVCVCNNSPHPFTPLLVMQLNASLCLKAITCQDWICVFSGVYVFVCLCIFGPVSQTWYFITSSAPKANLLSDSCVNFNWGLKNNCGWLWMNLFPRSIQSCFSDHDI